MLLDPITAIKLFLDALRLLDGKFTDHDQKDYTKLLRALAGFRLLTSPNEAEYAGSVISSAQKLRELLDATSQALPMRSGLGSGVLALGQSTRQFLTQVEGIEGSIRHQLDLITSNIDSGVQPDESQTSLLAHWKRNGYPERILRDNHNLNVMSIEWEGSRIQFLLALGNLRGQVGVFLSGLCEVMATELPEQLASLTPGLEGLTSHE